MPTLDLIASRGDIGKHFACTDCPDVKVKRLVVLSPFQPSGVYRSRARKYGKKTPLKEWVYVLVLTTEV